MEEKERYVYTKIDGCYWIKDTETNEDYCFISTIIKLLNKQDKRIKELEAINKVLSNELTKNSILKQDRIETCYGIPIYEIPKLKEENQQLKQSQKQLAIEKLQELKENILKIDKTEIKTLENGYSTLYVDRPEIINEINRQIKELGGGKNEN